jgi:D-lactate dehydrogenase (cytochrome)
MGQHQQLRKPLPELLVTSLSEKLGDRFTLSLPVREHHGKDESDHDVDAPDAVAFANTTEEVAYIAKLCNEFKIPLIPFGAGTSIEGHILATEGGISLDLSNMNQVLEIYPDDLSVKIQAGVRRVQLNQEIKDTGLFFPVDPGADATLGGMCATRASGTNAVRFGTMRENVLALTVVTADGQIIQTGTRAKKSSAGYDLTSLFIGSEGTLGIITEITLKIYPLPEAVSAAVCNFPTINHAVQTVISVIQLGIPIARVELIDEMSIKAINQYSKLGLTIAPTLFFEFQGSPTSVEEQSQIVMDIAQENKGNDFEWATKPEDRNRLWQARHNAYFACLQLQPGCKAVTTDVCVPISKLAACISMTRELLDQSHLINAILGHVGDGNFHVLIATDPTNPNDAIEAERLNAAIVGIALKMDGTCTGEHGIGIHKMPFLIEEHGQVSVDLMRSIKQTLDPNYILNPGKIFSRH